MYRIYNSNKSGFVEISERYTFLSVMEASAFRDRHRSLRNRVIIYYVHDYCFCLVNRLQLIQLDALHVEYVLCEVSHELSSKTKKSLC